MIHVPSRIVICAKSMPAAMGRHTKVTDAKVLDLREYRVAPHDLVISGFLKRRKGEN
jgi:hypothetical protein